MPNLNSLTEAPRKELHVFYLLDTSGSMEGAKISALNHAMGECLEALKTLAKSNGDAKLKVAVMEFNSNCRWVTSNGPEDLEEDFEYEYLQAGGLTNIGSALRELNSKLSQHAFLNSMTGAFMPVIIVMTDGLATDPDEYPVALAEIRNNRWFSHGIKIGIALGDEADVKMLSSVVGNSEAVIRATDLDTFKKLMKFVSVTTTMRASQSTPSRAATTGEDVIRDAEKEIDNLPLDAVVHLRDDEYDKEPEPQDDEAGGFDDGTW